MRVSNIRGWVGDKWGATASGTICVCVMSTCPWEWNEFPDEIHVCGECMKFPLEVDMCERNELLKNMHPSSVKLVVCMNGLARCALGG